MRVGVHNYVIREAPPTVTTDYPIFLTCYQYFHFMKLQCYEMSDMMYGISNKNMYFFICFYTFFL